MVLTTVTTPLLKGLNPSINLRALELKERRRIVALIFLALALRPFLISWLMVGIIYVDITALSVLVGISRPIITFSLSPVKGSIRPSRAASASWEVVSMNEADDNQEPVLRAERVIPKTTTWAVAGSPPAAKTLAFSDSKVTLSIISPGRRGGSP